MANMKQFINILALAALVAPAWPNGSVALADSRFIPAAAIDVTTLLAAVPKSGSGEDLADLDKILAYQSSRTGVDCKRASAAVFISLNTFFGPEFGPLTAEEVDNWSELFERVRLDTDHFVQDGKKRFGRARPYIASAKVKPCVQKEVTRAYPSGHAAVAQVFSLLLSDLDNARKVRFLARADQIAEDRVVAGLHYPTDVEAGKKLGAEVYKKLMAHEGFKKEFEALKAPATP